MNGEFDGKGSLWLMNGGRYVGSFKGGYFEGFGTLITINNNNV